MEISEAVFLAAYDYAAVAGSADGIQVFCNAPVISAQKFIASRNHINAVRLAFSPFFVNEPKDRIICIFNQ